MEENAKGSLVIIGGAEDKEGDRKILKHVVNMIGNENARLVILTTATEDPKAAEDKYRHVFSQLGVGDIQVLNINTRDEANDEKNAEIIKNCTGIFFTGGDQLRITSILGGTNAYEALHSAYSSGVTIIGTSAGASATSSTMIVDGIDNDAARKCTLKMAPGLKLLEGVIIDQHFSQRGRIGRILCGVAENPDILGIGIDEDTAVVVYPDAHFDVIGTNSVTIVDGTTIKSSNVSELKPNELLAIVNVTVHVLPAGYGFEMEKREVLRQH